VLDLDCDVPTLHLVIGDLDALSTGQLRGVLEREDMPGGHVVVDLRQMDDSHELTLFALLAGKARAVAEVTGNVTAVHASQRLGHLLRSVGIHVAEELPALAGLTGLEVVTVGRVLEDRLHW
jgi:hypothetical protein